MIIYLLMAWCAFTHAYSMSSYVTWHLPTYHTKYASTPRFIVFLSQASVLRPKWLFWYINHLCKVFYLIFGRVHLLLLIDPGRIYTMIWELCWYDQQFCWTFLVSSCFFYHPRALLCIVYILWAISCYTFKRHFSRKNEGLWTFE